MTRYETKTFLLLASLLFPVTGLSTELIAEETPASANSNNVKTDVIPELPAVGMTMKAARDLLKLETTNERLIGGGCGMLQILTNEDESLRVTSFDIFRLLQPTNNLIAGLTPLFTQSQTDRQFRPQGTLPERASLRPFPHSPVHVTA